MSCSRNALLLFAKPPIPGLVKTRLTKGKGGTLTEEEAAEFFRCCLLDVADISMMALEELEHDNLEELSKNTAAPTRSYDFVISTTPEENIAAMRAVFDNEGPWSRPIHYINDKGASFDEHFDDAFQKLFKQGYDNVVAIGGDHPTIDISHITQAFLWLDYFSKHNDHGYGFVHAACQDSGVALVGLTKTTPLSAQGVFYNTSGRPALDAYTEALRSSDIPNAFLPPVSDVDSDADLAHALSCINAMAEASYYQADIIVPLRVLEWLDAMGLQSVSAPNDRVDPRQNIDIIESISV